ncbi:MAG TPA: hypothetical protein VJ848_00470 [Candidatus Angelobacter sp.]|nr:hypothetical protein [Candidatus Angelobacter sp.]
MAFSEREMMTVFLSMSAQESTATENVYRECRHRKAPGIAARVPFDIGHDGRISARSATSLFFASFAPVAVNAFRCSDHGES